MERLLRMLLIKVMTGNTDEKNLIRRFIICYKRLFLTERTQKDGEN